MLQLFTYQATDGDFYRLRFGNNENDIHNIFIDSGRRGKKKRLRQKKALESFSSVVESIISTGLETIDSVFITHWDDDHIYGFWYFLQNANEDTLKKIGSVYMNSGTIRNHQMVENSIDHSYPKAMDVAKKLKDNVEWIDYVSYDIQDQKKPFSEIAGASVWIISPSNAELETLAEEEGECSAIFAGEDHGSTIIIPKSFSEELTDPTTPLEKDDSVTNQSSIAFLFEYSNIRIAFLGDADPDVCIKGLSKLGFSENNPCFVDYLKIPHHGSVKNYSEKLYQIIKANAFLLSTDGSRKNGVYFPHKAFLSHFMHNLASEHELVTVYCNYPWWNKWKNTRSDLYFSDKDTVIRNDNSLRIEMNFEDRRIALAMIATNEDGMIEIDKDW